jgi:hypothetical protein
LIGNGMASSESTNSEPGAVATGTLTHPKKPSGAKSVARPSQVSYRPAPASVFVDP